MQKGCSDSCVNSTLYYGGAWQEIGGGTMVFKNVGFGRLASNRWEMGSRSTKQVGWGRLRPLPHPFH